ncbi:MAG: hypothetical protein V1799_15975 [bacterium]
MPFSANDSHEESKFVEYRLCVNGWKIWSFFQRDANEEVNILSASMENEPPSSPSTLKLFQSVCAGNLSPNTKNIFASLATSVLDSLSIHSVCFLAQWRFGVYL